MLSARVLAIGVLVVGLGACTSTSRGASTLHDCGAAPTPKGRTDVGLRLTLPSTLKSGEELPVKVRLVSPTAQTVSSGSDHARIYVVRDGHIINGPSPAPPGNGAARAGTGLLLHAGPAGSEPLSAALSLYKCQFTSPTNDKPLALAPGEYEVIASVVLDAENTLVSAPVTVHVADS